MNGRITNIDRIIAKIDNDFNPDNSDWIPRVGAWVHDGLGLLSINTTKRVKERFKVIGRVAYSKNELKGNIKVYTCEGCEIPEYDAIKDNCESCSSDNIPSTGEEIQTIIENGAGTTSITVNNNPAIVPVDVMFKQINGGDGTRYNVEETYITKEKNINYVLVDNKHIELSFDTDCIIVEHDEVNTCHSNVYNCDFPEIPDNAKVIEFLAYWCIYKMLLRGYKHPVLNLHASQYGTNPYYIAQSLMEEAKRSYINDGVDDANNGKLTRLWRSSFFIGTFDPRN